jgi:hypothetical protein
MKVTEKQGNLSMSGKHGFLICTFYVHLLYENIHNKKRKTEPILIATKEKNLEINAKERKYMFSSCEHYAENFEYKINPLKYGHLVTAVTSTNCKEPYKVINSRLNS